MAICPQQTARSLMCVFWNVLFVKIIKHDASWYDVSRKVGYLLNVWLENTCVWQNKLLIDIMMRMDNDAGIFYTQTMRVCCSVVWYARTFVPTSSLFARMVSSTLCFIIVVVYILAIDRAGWTHFRGIDFLTHGHTPATARRSTFSHSLEWASRVPSSVPSIRPVSFSWFRSWWISKFCLSQTLPLLAVPRLTP